MWDFRWLPILCLSVLAAPALAAGFDRPVPQPQSESVELWYALASLLFCIALYAVHRLIKRR